jgi:NADH-quinone oxidoreductase subunit F
MLGSGAVMVMDDSTDMVKASLRLARFYARESCGKCTPCREGGTWLETIMKRILHGNGRPSDLDLLLDVGDGIAPGPFPQAPNKAKGIEAIPFPYKMTTICFVGPSAFAPIHSALTHFREEFEAKVTVGAGGDS